MSRSATEHRLEQKFQLRLYFFSGFILVSLALFVFQLGKLQLVWGYENRILAKKFVSQQEFMVAPRAYSFLGPAFYTAILAPVYFFAMSWVYKHREA